MKLPAFPVSRPFFRQDSASTHRACPWWTSQRRSRTADHTNQLGAGQDGQGDAHPASRSSRLRRTAGAVSADGRGVRRGRAYVEGAVDDRAVRGPQVAGGGARASVAGVDQGGGGQAVCRVGHGRGRVLAPEAAGTRRYLRMRIAMPQQKRGGEKRGIEWPCARRRVRAAPAKARGPT